MTKTTIEWTDATWNPVRGCSRISPGCEHCYAEKIAERFSGQGQPFAGFAVRGHGWTRKLALIEDKLGEPLHWRKPQRIFVNSMSDLFHESLGFDEIAQVFCTMTGEASAKAPPRHIYQVLTKRAQRMREFFEWLRALVDPPERLRALQLLYRYGAPSHVWLGVSVENQTYADLRIRELEQVPATVRFISAEPLLGPITLPSVVDVDWIIIGGESGPGARIFDLTWARDLVEQCDARGIAPFVKQLGSRSVDRMLPTMLYDRKNDRKGGDWTDWPPELRRREFPSGL